MRSMGSRSHIVRYTDLMSSGIPGHACNEPIEPTNASSHNTRRAGRRTMASLQVRSDFVCPKAPSCQVTDEMGTKKRKIAGTGTHNDGIAGNGP